MVYMNLATAQDFFSADNRVTSLSLTIKNPDEINTTQAALQQKVDGGRFEVMSWDEMMVEITQQLKVKTAGGKIIIAIL